MTKRNRLIMLVDLSSSADCETSSIFNPLAFPIVMRDSSTLVADSRDALLGNADDVGGPSKGSSASAIARRHLYLAYSL